MAPEQLAGQGVSIRSDVFSVGLILYEMFTGKRAFKEATIGGNRLVYVARTRAWFTPASRERLIEKLRPLKIATCPFATLPDARSGRRGEGLTAEKMKDRVWVRPELAAGVELVEWTPDNHLRHARFVGLKGI